MFKDVRVCTFYLDVFDCFTVSCVVCTSENKCCLTLKRNVFVFISSVKANLELPLFRQLSMSVTVHCPIIFVL